MTCKPSSFLPSLLMLEAINPYSLPSPKKSTVGEKKKKKKKKTCSDDSNSSAKKGEKKKVLDMSLKLRTWVTKSILCLIFLMHGATIQHLHYSTQKSNDLQFMILTELWPWRSGSSNLVYELVDLKQSYNHANFEWPPLNSVCKKVNNSCFVKWRNMSMISLSWKCPKVDTAVTLKYGHGHWNWYAEVKLNEWYHQAKFRHLPLLWYLRKQEHNRFSALPANRTAQRWSLHQLIFFMQSKKQKKSLSLSLILSFSLEVSLLPARIP